MIDKEKVIKGLEHEIARTDLEWIDYADEGYKRWAKRYEANIQAQREYEAAVEMAEYCKCYEPTYNTEDGSM